MLDSWFVLISAYDKSADIMTCVGTDWSLGASCRVNREPIDHRLDIYL